MTVDLSQYGPEQQMALLDVPDRAVVPLLKQNGTTEWVVFKETGAYGCKSFLLVTVRLPLPAPPPEPTWERCGAVCDGMAVWVCTRGKGHPGEHSCFHDRWWRLWGDPEPTPAPSDPPKQRTRKARKLKPGVDVLESGGMVRRLSTRAERVTAYNRLGSCIGYWTPDERVPLAPKPPKDAP
jgi:hypothetical protein